MDLRWLQGRAAAALLPGPTGPAGGDSLTADGSPGRMAQRWSAAVSRRAPALDLEAGVFTWSDPERIAASLLQSAQRSTARQRSAYASAMAMLCFYINRAGRQLPAARRAVLEQAKQQLRLQAGR